MKLYNLCENPKWKQRSPLWAYANQIYYYATTAGEDVANNFLPALVPEPLIPQVSWLVNERLKAEEPKDEPPRAS